MEESRGQITWDIVVNPMCFEPWDVYSHSSLGDVATDYLSKLVKWSVNRFLEMSGWVPSVGIFNLLDRWTEEGFQLPGG